MKKLLQILFIALLATQVANAQTTRLWATAEFDGALGYGTILRGDGDGSNFHAAHAFDQVNGSMPLGKMAMASNGKLYGVTWLGGFGDSCITFSYDRLAGVCTNVYDFFYDLSKGWDAWSGMIAARDGMLYGLCSAGGAYGNGVIYRIDPTTDIYTDIYDFDGTTGGGGMGGLMQASNGKLYGISRSGGVNNAGVIFSYDPATSVYTKEFDFIPSLGTNPQYNDLIEAADGNLYGMLPNYYSSELSNYLPGVIFRFNIATRDYTVLHYFDGTHGGLPYGSLVQANDGKLYGLTQSGGTFDLGVMFSWDLNSGSYAELFDFNGTSNGANPERSLVQGSNGKLFATARGGGSNSNGVIFSYDIRSSSYTKLLDCNINTGTSPSSDIIETIENSTGIPSASSSGGINIFPNPAVNYITIENLNEPITMTDVLGKVIVEINPTQLGKTTIDISSYPPVFFLRTSNGVVKKIMKGNE